jgi:peptidoglycan/LPS O-acetylase OafA/YrhL
VAVVKPQRSRRVRAAVRSGSDNAYGIYLSHMLFITALTWAGWGKLSAVIPWPALCLATVAIVIACGAALTGLLARTPLAGPLTADAPGCRGGGREPLPLQSAAAPASDQGVVRDSGAVRNQVPPPRRAA